MSRYYDDDGAWADSAEATSGRLRSGSAAVALSRASVRHAQQQRHHLRHGVDWMTRRHGLNAVASTRGALRK